MKIKERLQTGVNKNVRLVAMSQLKASISKKLADQDTKISDYRLW